LLDEFELELLDHTSELVFVDALFEVFVLVLPASALVAPKRIMTAAPTAADVARLRRFMATSKANVRARASRLRPEPDLNAHARAPAEIPRAAHP
jgi:hypothetical protein